MDGAFSRSVGAFAVLCTILVASPETSHAAGPPGFVGVPQGTAEPADLPVRTELEKRIYDLKMEVGDLVRNHQQVPATLVAQLRQFTGDQSFGSTGPSAVPFFSSSSGNSVSPYYLYNGTYYATVDGSVATYTEPVSLPSGVPNYGSSFTNNMCGPGSATKLLSNYMQSTINSFNSSPWSGSGLTSPQAYMVYLGMGAPNPGGTSYNHYAINPNQGMMNKNDSTAGNNWNTENGDEGNVINQVRGVTFYTYGTDYAGDGSSKFGSSAYPSSRFLGELASDLEYSGVPMVLTALSTTLQDGWNVGETHLVAVNGYNPTADQIEFFDSASNQSAYGQTVQGFHILHNITGLANGQAIYDSVW